MKLNVAKEFRHSVNIFNVRIPMVHTAQTNSSYQEEKTKVLRS